MGSESGTLAGSAASDREILDVLDPAVRDWWVDRFGSPEQDGGCLTPPQREAIPLIHEGENALVAAPTGSGKTLASFTAILNELFEREQREGGLDNGVYCLYVSPLKSLANDIERNLANPLDGIADRLADRGVETDVRQAIRHGDTSDYERQQMLETAPHILNTTPETLAILLNSPKFRERLESVEYVVVDEIHSLADSEARHPPLGEPGATPTARRRVHARRLLGDRRAAVGHRAVPRGIRRERGATSFERRRCRLS